MKTCFFYRYLVNFLFIKKLFYAAQNSWTAKSRDDFTSKPVFTSQLLSFLFLTECGAVCSLYTVRTLIPTLVRGMGPNSSINRLIDWLGSLFFSGTPLDPVVFSLDTRYFYYENRDGWIWWTLVDFGQFLRGGKDVQTAQSLVPFDEVNVAKISFPYIRQNFIHCCVWRY